VLSFSKGPRHPQTPENLYTQTGIAGFSVANAFAVQVACPGSDERE